MTDRNKFKIITTTSWCINLDTVYTFTEIKDLFNKCKKRFFPIRDGLFINIDQVLLVEEIKQDERNNY